MRWSSLKWEHVNPEFEHKLQTVINSWIGTRYMRGQQVKGVGVDCVRFVCGVLDEIQGRNTDKIEDLPADACMENPQGAVSVMKTIMRRYEYDKINHKRLPIVRPGDIVLTGTEKGPGHAMIVGTVDNQLWHCNGICVTSTVASFPKRGIERLYAIFRLRGI